MPVPELLETKLVNISTLKSYPNNPRNGDLARIKESIETHGQNRPLLVQKSTRYVLVGNHTMLALIDLGYKKAMVQFIDCDDDQAKKIVLADNRTSDVAQYDESQLAQLLDSLDDLDGTAFDDGDLNRILANVADEVPKFDPAEAGSVPRLDKKTVVNCPNCGHEL